jgi:hypothetical protein
MISKVTVRAPCDMATGIRPTEIEIDLQVDVDVCEGFRDDIRMALDDCFSFILDQEVTITFKDEEGVNA